MKKKKFFSKMLVFALIISFILSSVTMLTQAVEQDKYHGGSQNGGTIDNSVQGGKFDYFLKQSDMGVRLYVTDEEGRLYPSTKGYDVIDFLYDEFLRNNSLNKSSVKLRSVSTLYQKANYSIQTASILDLGFNTYQNNHSHDNCDCLSEYFVDSIRHGISGPTGNVLKMKMYDKEAGQTKSKAEEIMEEYWMNVVEIIQNQDPKATNAKKFYLNMEIIMTITHHVTNPNRPVWYGTVFELGWLSQSTYNSYTTANGYKNMRHDYQNRLANAFSIMTIDEIPETYRDTSLFPYLNVAKTGKAMRSLDEIRTGAYGINIISLNRVIKPVIEVEETDVPVSNGMTVQREESTALAKVEAVDNVEIRTGYAAQNGYYDIGVDSGIPTTEEIRNVIEAQDCIIDYGYVIEKYVPTVMPKVTYNLRYYFPCDVKTYTTEETDYDDPIWNTDPMTGEDYVAGYGTKTVTHEYCGYEGKGSAPHGDHYHNAVYTKVVDVPRAAVYYRITDYMIYGLESVSVVNACGSASYDNLSPIESVDVVISGLDNATDLDNVALDTHVDYRDVVDLTFDHNAINGGIFNNKAAAEAWVNANGFNYANEKVGVPKVANDKLIINFKDDRGAVELMDNKWCERESMNDSFVVVTPTPNPVPKYKIIKDSVEHIEIPYGLMNGNYSTKIYAMYFLYAGSDEHGMVAMFKNSAAPDHIVNESVALKSSPYTSKTSVSYASQEPIHVRTPIISPFHTDDDDRMKDLTESEKSNMTEEEIEEYEREQSLTGTQLVNEIDCQQLRLDETYTLTFDPAMHEVWLGYGYSGLIDNENYWNGYVYDGEIIDSDNKYDKYVAKKAVKFPFDVYIQDRLFEANSWISVYEYDAATNVVSAGDIKTPLLTDVEYYIPSWALDSMISSMGGVGSIETAVYALNYNGSEEHGETFNDEDPETWSKNAITVQLSGWVYDFKITGISDPTHWTTSDERDEMAKKHDMNFSFSDAKREYYMGIYNRLGEDLTGGDENLRRDKDESLDTNIDAKTNVLPLQAGSSIYGIENGTVARGTEFSYSLKTMDNLTDVDGISIIPTYTYYSEDFNTILEMDEMEMYYIRDYKLRKLGSADDEPYMVTTYRDSILKSVITEDELLYTARNNQHKDEEHLSSLTDKDVWWYAGEQKMLNASFSKIGLTDWAMTFTNPLSELKMNVERDEKNKLFTNIIGNPYENGNITLSSKTDALKQSTQQWTGTYSIPRQLYILNLNKLHEMGYETLQDYLDKNAYINYKEEFWQSNDGGYLILNFQITAYKDGKPYMTMESGSSDQWIRQGRKEYITIHTFYTRKHALAIAAAQNISYAEAIELTGHKIEMKSGDIMVIRIASEFTPYLTEAVAFS